MRVKVFAPYFSDRSKLDEEGWLELPDGADLGNTLQAIRVPKWAARMLMASVNGVSSPLDTQLYEGDRVSFITLIAGG